MVQYLQLYFFLYRDEPTRLVKSEFRILIGQFFCRFPLQFFQLCDIVLTRVIYGHNPSGLVHLSCPYSTVSTVRMPSSTYFYGFFLIFRDEISVSVFIFLVASFGKISNLFDNRNSNMFGRQLFQWSYTKLCCMSDWCCDVIGQWQYLCLSTKI